MQIMVDGKIDIKEMYKTFNMGIGFCIIVSKDKVEDIIDTINKDNHKCQIIGKIKSNGNGNTFIKINEELLKI